MPNSRPVDRLREWFRPDAIDRWSIVLVFAVYLSFSPFFPGMHSANEFSRLYLTYALVDEHDIEITAQVRIHGDILDKAKVDGSLFSDKPPGSAFVAAPFIAVRRVLGGEPDLGADMRLARLAAGVLPTLVLLLLLRLEMAGLGISPPTRALVLATYGLGTLGFTYSTVFYGHQLTAVLLYTSWFLLRKRHVRLSRTAIAGFLAGLCVSVEYQSAIFLVPLAVVFVIRTRPLVPGLVTAALGASIPLVALLLYHVAAFGGPFRTGYDFIADPFFSTVHDQGFMGLDMPRIEPVWMSLVSSSKGLLFFSPFMVLGLLGLWPFLRGCGSVLERIQRVALVVLPVLFVGSLVYWDGGWTVGQRHWTPLVPFLMAPAAILIDRSFYARVFAPMLAAISIGATGAATVVYPHLPQWLPNPLHDITLPLLAGGCLSDVWWADPWVAAAVLLTATAVLVVGVVTLWPDRLSRKVLSVVLMAVVPITWYDGTSRIGRLGPEELASEQGYFIGQCRKAGRWEESKILPGSLRRGRIERRDKSGLFFR